MGETATTPTRLNRPSGAPSGSSGSHRDGKRRGGAPEHVRNPLLNPYYTMSALRHVGSSGQAVCPRPGDFER